MSDMNGLQNPNPQPNQAPYQPAQQAQPDQSAYMPPVQQTQPVQPDQSAYMPPVQQMQPVQPNQAAYMPPVQPMQPIQQTAPVQAAYQQPLQQYQPAQAAYQPAQQYQPVQPQPAQQFQPEQPVDETPEEKKAGNRLSRISLILQIAGVAISSIISSLEAYAATGIGEYSYSMPDTLNYILSFAISGTYIASIILMIIARVKYKKNKFAKVLMWIYIGEAALAVVTVVLVWLFFAALCTACNM